MMDPLPSPSWSVSFPTYFSGMPQLGPSTKSHSTSPHQTFSTFSIFSMYLPTHANTIRQYDAILILSKTLAACTLPVPSHRPHNPEKLCSIINRQLFNKLLPFFIMCQPHILPSLLRALDQGVPSYLPKTSSAST